MITTYNELENYFNTDKFDTDEKVTLQNDMALVLLFIKKAISRLTEFSAKIEWSNSSYRWSRDSDVDETYIGKRKLSKNNFSWGWITYKGGSLTIDIDSSKCIFISNGKKRKSLKVDDTAGTVIIRPKWISPLITSDTEIAVARESNMKIQQFQNDLLIPYMLHQLTEAGITSYTVHNHTITFEKFGTGWYNTLRTSPIINVDDSTDDMEQRLWSLSIKRDHYTNLPFYSVIAIIKGFYAAGYIK